MSLTAHLNHPASPVRQFFEAEFPDLTALRTAYRDEIPAGLSVMNPPLPPGVRAPTTLGAAIDHRLRFALADQPSPGTAVEAGIKRLPTAAGPTDEASRRALFRAGRNLLRELARLVAEHHPARRDRPLLLPDPVEERLTRACYAASWYEEVFRSGRLAASTPMGTATADLTLDDLLAAVPGFAVEDVVTLTRAAQDALGPIRGKTAPAQVTPGPSFAGSGDVAGADADWIAAGLLIDVKATIRPRQLDTAEVYQLLGYTLLDYTDEYSITAVGWYQARIARLIAWPLSDVLTLLGTRRSLAELREHLADVTHSLPRRDRSQTHATTSS